MPLYHEERRQPEVSVHPSVALEMDWVLSTAHTLPRAGSPVLEAVYGQHPELAEAVRGLWGEEESLSYPGYLEISVLAQRAGLLFSTDSDELLGALDAAGRAGGADLPFLSETPADRDRLRTRLEVLRRSSARRRRYIATLSEVWSKVRGEWERAGLPAVEATIEDARAQLEKGRRWEQFVRIECAPAESVVAGLAVPAEVAIVPAWFTHRGMVVDLPALVVVGIRADSDAAGSRARTEPLARRLKALSDPTRLAILDALGREEMTVTELAARFSLSQPTISNHVKVLRDAGVVADRRSASRRVLTVERSVVEDTLRGVGDLLGPPRS